MRNPTGKKLEKIIFKLFDDASQGVDRYNHNGSLWAIFTNEMRWVVEFTKDQTLWYNYNFFKNEMELIGLDCVENKDLIQKWFESRFLGIPKAEDSCEPFFDQDQYVEDTIQNGVKQTELSKRDFFPKDIIKNVVRMTKSTIISQDSKIKDTIKNGVKETIGTLRRTAKWGVDDIIQNGVKNLGAVDYDNLKHVEDIIENGVKETYDDCSNNIARVEGIIRIGEKIS